MNRPQCARGHVAKDALRRAVFSAFALAWGQIALAQQQAGNAVAVRDPVELLQRLYNATKGLSYSGTFVYQHGQHTETSRIVRRVDASGTYERIEVLDGSPREIIRSGDEVKAYLPGSQTVKIEKATSDRPMLPIMFSQVRELTAVYTIKGGETERIAGFEAQSISLIPRDTMRYAHRFWSDVATGMLVKAQTFDEHLVLVEQFMFTQLRIGGPISRNDLRPRYAAAARDWRVHEAGPMTPMSDSAWILRSPPAGFKKIAEMRRSFSGNVEVSHLVVSDGIASISVFIESAGRGKPNPPPIGLSRQGTINVFTRKLDEFLVTVVGEAPAACVEAIAVGIESRTTAGSATVTRP